VLILSSGRTVAGEEPHGEATAREQISDSDCVVDDLAAEHDSGVPIAMKFLFIYWTTASMRNTLRW
jgi:hypothetical protein